MDPPGSRLPGQQTRSPTPEHLTVARHNDCGAGDVQAGHLDGHRAIEKDLGVAGQCRSASGDVSPRNRHGTGGTPPRILRPPPQGVGAALRLGIMGCLGCSIRCSWLCSLDSLERSSVAARWSAEPPWNESWGDRVPGRSPDHAPISHWTRLQDADVVHRDQQCEADTERASCGATESDGAATENQQLDGESDPSGDLDRRFPGTAGIVEDVEDSPQRRRDDWDADRCDPSHRPGTHAPTGGSESDERTNFEAEAQGQIPTVHLWGIHTSTPERASARLFSAEFIALKPCSVWVSSDFLMNRTSTPLNASL